MATTFSIPSEVQAVLRNALFTANSVTLPPGQLDRDLYVKVDKVLQAAGGRWNRKAKAHHFDRDPRDLLAQMMESGKATNVKQALQAFYTPIEVADRMVELVRLQDGDSVLEPEAGEGALLDAARGTGIIHEHQAVEIDPIACERLRAKGYTVWEGDFLEVVPFHLERPDWSVVLMNPPFHNGAAVEHLKHALRFLRCGGRLACIMPLGWQRKTDRKTTTLVERLGDYDVEEEELPEGSFHESGTDVRTCIVVVRA